MDIVLLYHPIPFLTKPTSVIMTTTCYTNIIKINIIDINSQCS